MSNKRLDLTTKSIAVLLYMHGHSSRAISKYLGISRSTLQYFIYDFKPLELDISEHLEKIKEISQPWGRPRKEILPNEKIQDLLDKGYSIRKIAKELGFSYGTIRNRIKNVH